MKGFKIKLVFSFAVLFILVVNPVYSSSNTIYYYTHYSVKAGDEMTYTITSNPKFITRVAIDPYHALVLSVPNGTLITVRVNKTEIENRGNLGNLTSVYEQTTFTLPNGTKYTSMVMPDNPTVNLISIQTSFSNVTALKEYLNKTDYPYKWNYTITGNLIDFNEASYYSTMQLTYNWQTGWLKSMQGKDYDLSNHSLTLDYIIDQANTNRPLLGLSVFDPGTLITVIGIIAIPVVFAVGAVLALKLKKKK